jgi:hypothetical protein
MPPISLEYVAHAISNLDYEFNCQDTHLGCSCNGKAAQMFIRGFMPVLKTYFPVHVVPFLLFKRKKFIKE